MGKIKRKFIGNLCCEPLAYGEQSEPCKHSCVLKNEDGTFEVCDHIQLNPSTVEHYECECGYGFCEDHPEVVITRQMRGGIWCPDCGKRVSDK